ncbi:hypothetical protein BJY04DRAFT_193384 [Aspergillus karnatakaensis]|uniref:uncharacterized protein n=1 Tax=Aspergillus karnatakaensis TaxID=1810916 RepID=UPI003CCDF505
MAWRPFIHPSPGFFSVSVSVNSKQASLDWRQFLQFLFLLTGTVNLPLGLSFAIGQVKSEGWLGPRGAVLVVSWNEAIDRCQTTIQEAF